MTKILELFRAFHLSAHCKEVAHLNAPIVNNHLHNHPLHVLQFLHKVSIPERKQKSFTGKVPIKISPS